MQDPEYLSKVQKYNDGKMQKSKIQFTEFNYHGSNIYLPFKGQKMTAGYLKKESKSVGFMFSKFWQSKYFVLDLYKFEFKYSKQPNVDFTLIPLREIIDVKLEKDPSKNDVRTDRSVFSLVSQGDNTGDAFIFQLITSSRTYRL